MCRCIMFNLYDVDADTTIPNLVAEIKMSFFHRAKCRIKTEEYKRCDENISVIIKIDGEDDSINKAIEETKYIFSKWCKLATCHT